MNPSLIITPNAQEAGKLFSIVPTDGSGDLTVTRATTATYVGSDGLIKTAGVNEVRFDYSNGSCPSILVQPQRTNYFTNSFDADSSDWSKSNVIKNGNSTTEIIQGVIGKRYDPIGTSVFPSIARSGAFASSINGQITYYTIVEYSGWKWIELTTTQSTPIERVWFDLENGIKGTDVNNVGNIVKLKNNCYLLSHTTKSRANGATGTMFFSFRSSDNSTSAISGNGTGITFHACQFEVGSNATSYIPTTASTVTRNADNISKSDIYTNNFITSSGGVLAFKIKNNIPYIRDEARGLALNTGTTVVTGNGILLTNITSNSAKKAIRIYVANSVVSILALTEENPKVAIVWDGTKLDIYVNGTKRTSGISFPVVAMQHLIMETPSITFYDNVLLFPTPLSDSQLITLTT
jgi:hypothetical protein